MSHPFALLVGSSEPAAGIDGEAIAATMARHATVARFNDLPAAAEFIAGEQAVCELIVLCESRRGEFADEPIESLRHLAPLARVWRVVGAWHEGEQRSGRPPAGCTTMYWHQLPARLERMLARQSLRHLPPTATPEERLLADAGATIEPRGGTISICAERYESADALADALRRAGYETLIHAQGDHARNERITAIVWDATPEELSDEAAVNRIRGIAPEAPLVAVVGFPRADDVRQARDLGVSAVISKPYLLRDLLWKIEQACALRPGMGDGD